MFASFNYRKVCVSAWVCLGCMRPAFLRADSLIDQVQRRSARWTVNNFDRQASATEILQKPASRTFGTKEGWCLTFVFVLRLYMEISLFQHMYSTVIEYNGTATTWPSGRSSLQEITTDSFYSVEQWGALSYAVSCRCMLAEHWCFRLQSARYNTHALRSWKLFF